MKLENAIGNLTEPEINELFSRCNVTPLGQALVRNIRESEPVSAPLSSRNKGNVVGLYPSSLMRAGLQIGSVGYDLLLFSELDNRSRHPDLLEFWNRPTEIRNVCVEDMKGNCKTKVCYRPRVLCIRENRICFLDLIDDAKLLESESKGNNLYMRTSAGDWTSPAFIAALAPFGIGHELWALSQFGGFHGSNISYLSSAFRSSAVPPDQTIIRQIVSRVEAETVVYRRELIAEGFSADAIKWTVAMQLVYFPIEEEDLTSIEGCRLYLDRSAYLHEVERRRTAGAGAPLPIRMILPRTGQRFQWHGVSWIVANAGTSFTLKRDEGGWLEVSLIEATRFCEEGAWQYDLEPPPLLVNSSPKRRDEAAAKLALLSLDANKRVWTYGKRKGKPVSEASINRIKAAVAKADAEGTSRIEALILAYDNCGDHSARVDGEMAIWRDSLAEDYKVNHRPRFSSAYAAYCKRCAAAGVKPVSETTARKRLSLEDKSEIVEERSGEFVAYQRGKYTPRNKSNRLVKGRIPWEVAHVDHALIEVKVVSCITGNEMTRPLWRTVLRDACSFRVLGLVVFFGAPSYVVLYRLILDVARRFGMLPQYIITDRGMDFKSNQWETTLAEFDVCRLLRPSKTPRAGQVAEAGNFKDDMQVISNLPGNKLNLPDFRSLSKGFRPEDSAELSLGRIREILEEVYFDVEPKHPTSRTKGEPLQDFENRLLSEVGRSHIPLVPYTSHLRLLCMPAVEGRGGTRVVSSQGSVECHNLEYFSPALRQAGVVSSARVVHYDPDNVGHVFVWLGREIGWVECRCDAYDVLCNFTPAELDEYTAYLTRTGEGSKVAQRRNRAVAYAKVLTAGRRSEPLVLMHEIARENAHGLPGFEINDGKVAVDLPIPEPSNVESAALPDEPEGDVEIPQY
jgi:putative transposase